MKACAHRLALVLVVGAALALSAACSGGSPKADAYGEQNAIRITDKEIVVALTGLQFVPQGIRIKTGTKVTWLNKDVAVHNVSQIQSKFLSPGDLEEGATFSFTFETPGVYRYQCTLHHPDMNGVVIVEE